MPIKLWKQESNGSLSSSVRTIWDSPLGGEEHRKLAEDLDRALDDVLDDALAQLSATGNRGAKPEFRRLWCVGRAVRESNVLRHPALEAEKRMLLWRAMAWKCWLGARHDYPQSPEETEWRRLRPSAQPENKNPSRMDDVFEIGFWMQEQEIEDAVFTFGGVLSNAKELGLRKSINTPKMREALKQWLNYLPQEQRKEVHTSSNFKVIAKALRKRWPDRGFGSARRPEHTKPEVLLAEVTETLSPVLEEVINSPATVPLSPTVS